MKAGLQVMKNPQFILLKQEIKDFKCVCSFKDILEELLLGIKDQTK